MIIDSQPAKGFGKQAEMDYHKSSNDLNIPETCGRYNSFQTKNKSESFGFNRPTQMVTNQSRPSQEDANSLSQT